MNGSAGMSDKIRYAFLGCTKFSERLLSCLVGNGIAPEVVFTTPEVFKISYSEEPVKNYNYSSLSEICIDIGVPIVSLYDCPSNKIENYIEYIRELELDVILVMGWYFMVPAAIRNLAKKGAWGIHASLLPKYAGGAPLTWAIINGESQTGVTLFQLDAGVDTGDIIAQEKISIGFEDCIASVYERATSASETLILNALHNFNSLELVPQDMSQRSVFPQRAPNDGLIDMNKSAQEIYNFVRAQSHPYPGAFFIAGDGGKVIIEKVRLA
jgi:methionyl-tRNA formyltransferase